MTHPEFLAMLAGVGLYFAAGLALYAVACGARFFSAEPNGGEG